MMMYRNRAPTNRYVWLFFSKGEFGSSMPGATSLLATPEIFVLESVVPLCPNAGTASAVPAHSPIRMSNRFIDLASGFGVRQPDGCVPGYSERALLGRGRRNRNLSVSRSYVSAPRFDPRARAWCA